MSKYVVEYIGKEGRHRFASGYSIYTSGLEWVGLRHPYLFSEDILDKIDKIVSYYKSSGPDLVSGKIRIITSSGKLVYSYDFTSHEEFDFRHIKEQDSDEYV